LGHPVLLIDLRGHGESEPGVTTLGAREPLDVEAWMAFLRQQGESKPILWGTSLGAVSVLRAAAVDSEVAGVIADAPFDTLRHTLAVHAKLFFCLPEFPLVSMTAWQIERRLHFAISEVDSFAAVAKIHAPLLVLAAENDRRMVPSSVRAIFDRANEPKRFYLIPGEDHETRRFEPGFRETVASFLDLCDGEGTPEGAKAAP
jgi:hypothetical protein